MRWMMEHLMVGTQREQGLEQGLGTTTWRGPMIRTDPMMLTGTTTQ